MVHHRLAIPLLAILVLVVSVSILAIGSRHRSAAPVAIPSPAPVGNAVFESQNPEGTPRDVVLITLLPNGFEPTEVTHRAEPFLLVVQNRSGKPNTPFTYDWNFGKTKKPKRIPQKRDSQAEVVNLQPGSYNIGVANRPDWNCKLIITQGN